jgi:hypothetical protein
VGVVVGISVGVIVAVAVAVGMGEAGTVGAGVTAGADWQAEKRKTRNKKEKCETEHHFLNTKDTKDTKDDEARIVPAPS